MEDTGYWTHDIGPLMEGGPHVAVRVEMRGGRLVMTDLILHSDAGVNSTHLRELSLPALEARTANKISSRERVWQGDPTYEQLRALWRDAEDSVSLGRLMRHTAGRGERPRLSRPASSDAEEFYSLVAWAYREYAEGTRAPAKKIAEEAEVPVTTAHRWIREARRRGLLPPGQQGRAG
ncbi:hypothetical protein [Kineococcus terrestris]|uniref:hypothetical protein n=1 Tax=Kineococcus terrestris TaxID=2044856 RepID=UPI0034DB4E3A